MPGGQSLMHLENSGLASPAGRLKPLLNDYESLGNFVHHPREVRGQQRLLRIDDYIGGNRVRRASEPYGLPQPAFHAIPLDSAAESAANRESDAQPGGGRRLLRSVKNGHRRRKVPAPLLVHALEVGVTQQPRAARKHLAPCPAGHIDSILRTHWRSQRLENPFA